MTIMGKAIINVLNDVTKSSVFVMEHRLFAINFRLCKVEFKIYYADNLYLKVYTVLSLSLKSCL
jgi:hypothetical protein